MIAMRNWSGNVTYGAHEIRHPASLDEVAGLVAHAPRVRALGTRHSFTDIADAPCLIALDRLPAAIAVDHAAATVSLSGAVTYAELAAALAPEGVALPNLASLPHISVAGSIATATHGAGDRHGNLATAVRGLELVTSAGEALTLRRGEEEFDGAVVGLGALGIVTRVTLAVEPAYEVAQDVYEGLSWEALLEEFDAIMAAGDSVSVFHRFGTELEQLWIKRRVPAGATARAAATRFGATAASAPRHPILDADPVNATPQLGVPGPWSERLPHFRSGFTPSAGEEIQAEIFVAREHVAAALHTLRGMAAAIRPLLLVAEIRTIAADPLWLSPQYGRDSVGLHFTWALRPREVDAVWQRIEAALAPLQARSHWGKLLSRGAAEIGPGYPRFDDFRALRAHLDPRGAFVNDWLRRHVLGELSGRPDGRR